MARVPYAGASSRAAPQRDRSPSAMTGRSLYQHLSMLGITHMRFARLVGSDARTVRRWCSGESPVPESIARVVRMAAAGDLSLEALYAYRSENYERPVDSEGGAVDEESQIR